MALSFQCDLLIYLVKREPMMSDESFYNLKICRDRPLRLGLLRQKLLHMFCILFSLSRAIKLCPSRCLSQMLDFQTKDPFSQLINYTPSVSLCLTQFDLAHNLIDKRKLLTCGLKLSITLLCHSFQNELIMKECQTKWSRGTNK